MDLNESLEDRRFREEARAWLADHAPREARPSEGAPALAFDRDWQRTLYDGGWAGVNWPKAYGGRGLSGFQYMIWLQECARVGAPVRTGATYTGLYHAGPTLIARANEAQKAEHLPKILKGDTMWCQGFSEPGAGTDLAALRCRGEVQGDEIVVNGHKTWTSNGQNADLQELLIRTDPESTRHRGLTWVICDMRSAGLQVRPIRTMLGDSHVNDTFYDNVRIPLSNVVGEIGDGWSVAMSTFAFERGIGFIGDQIELVEFVEALIATARKTRLSNGRLAIEDDAIAQNLAALKAEILALRSMNIGGLAYLDRHGQPGPEGSMMKLLITTVYKKLHLVAVEILGPEILEFGEGRASNPWTYRYLFSWVMTIAGGSNEIQRDVIADRILGLPRAR